MVAELVRQQSGVAEPGEGVRLAAVVARCRPVDGLVGRAVVGRRALLVEPAAGGPDGGPVDLDLGLGHREALAASGLRCTLTRHLTRLRRYGARSALRTGGLAGRTVIPQRTCVAPRSTAYKLFRFRLRSGRAWASPGAWPTGHRPSEAAARASGSRCLVAGAGVDPADRHAGRFGPEPEPPDQLESDDQGQDGRGREGQQSQCAGSRRRRGGRTVDRPRNSTRDESRVGAVKAPAAVPGLPQPGRTVVMGVVNVTPTPSPTAAGGWSPMRPSPTATSWSPRVPTSWTSAASRPGPERSARRSTRSSAGCCRWCAPWRRRPASASTPCGPRWPRPPWRVPAWSTTCRRQADPAMLAGRPGRGALCLHALARPLDRHAEPRDVRGRGRRGGERAGGAGGPGRTGGIAPIG